MSNGEVKLGLYMTTGRHHGRTFLAIRDMVEKLLPNGEIKVTTPDMQDLERVVAELKAEIERLTRDKNMYRDGFSESEKNCLAWNRHDTAQRKTIATQKRVIAVLTDCIIKEDHRCGIWPEGRKAIALATSIDKGEA